jgi:hypothetical protein
VAHAGSFANLTLAEFQIRESGTLLQHPLAQGNIGGLTSRAEQGRAGQGDGYENATNFILYNGVFCITACITKTKKYFNS